MQQTLPVKERYSLLQPSQALNITSSSAADMASLPSTAGAVGVAFPSLPKELFFYSVASDKLETAVALESKSSKDQWCDYQNALRHSLFDVRVAHKV